MMLQYITILVSIISLDNREENTYLAKAWKSLMYMYFDAKYHKNCLWSDVLYKLLFLMLCSALSKFGVDMSDC